MTRAREIRIARLTAKLTTRFALLCIEEEAIFEIPRIGLSGAIRETLLRDCQTDLGRTRNRLARIS